MASAVGEDVIPSELVMTPNLVTFHFVVLTWNKMKRGKGVELRK